MSDVTTHTSDWRSRSKAQLLDGMQALIEMRDREIARADQFAESLRMMTEKFDQAEAKRTYWKQKAEAHGSCPCNIGTGTDGPDECCPEHGRTYSDWIERGDILQRRLTEREDEVVRLSAQLARLVPERRTRDAYGGRVDEISWCTPWEPVQPFECCASGRCEVCSPGFDWGRDG